MLGMQIFDCRLPFGVKEVADYVDHESQIHNGDKVNGRLVNALGWITTLVIFSASGSLVFTWLSRLRKN
jgi:hypothetical protein